MGSYVYIRIYYLRVSVIMADGEETDEGLDPFAAALITALPPGQSTSNNSYQDWEYSSLVRKQSRLIDLATRLLRRKEIEIQRRERGRPNPYAKTAELESAIADLKQENKELRALVKREAMHPNSRSSIERVMLVAIVKAYGAIPGETSRSESIATRLASDAELFGLTVDPKTVRKYSEQAARHHKLRG